MGMNSNRKEKVRNQVTEFVIPTKIITILLKQYEGWPLSRGGVEKSHKMWTFPELYLLSKGGPGTELNKFARKVSLLNIFSPLLYVCV